MVDFLKITNDAISTLASDINSSIDYLDVASGDGDLYPETAPFHISIGEEIIEVGARSDDRLSSLVRAQQDTTAASHSEGDAVELRWTAKHLNDVTDELLRIGGEMVGMEDLLKQQLILLEAIALHLAKLSGQKIDKKDVS